jgi:type IV pilus assembly protein PilC
MRASGETRGQGHAAPPGHHWSPRSRSSKTGGGGSVTEKDVTLFTRQLATMMKAGVPLLQAFDIVGKGALEPRRHASC